MDVLKIFRGLFFSFFLCGICGVLLGIIRQKGYNETIALITFYFDLTAD